TIGRVREDDPHGRGDARVQAREILHRYVREHRDRVDERRRGEAARVQGAVPEVGRYHHGVALVPRETDETLPETGDDRVEGEVPEGVPARGSVRPDVDPEGSVGRDRPARLV